MTAPIRRFSGRDRIVMTRVRPIHWAILAAWLLATAAQAQEAGDRPGVENPKPAARPKGRRIALRMPGDPRPLSLTVPDPADLKKSDDPGWKEDETPPPLKLGRVIAVEQVANVGPENFDLWLFGKATTPYLTSIQLGRKLDARLGEAVAEFRLSDEQRAKLELAGRGDIKHFLGRIEQERAAFEQVRGNFHTARRFLNQLGPLQAELDRGPFGFGSLFDKTLRTIRFGPSAPGPTR